MKIHLGIDPGPTNLGWALLSEDRTFAVSGVFDYKPFSDTSEGSTCLFNTILSHLPEDAILLSAGIERYVPYSGKFTSNGEKVCEIIGSLTLLMYQRGIKYVKVRAIDWKIAVVKALYILDGFHNSAEQLNKEFSVSAAKHILNGEKVFKTDHEADAFGLAYFSCGLYTRGFYERTEQP